MAWIAVNNLSHYALTLCLLLFFRLDCQGKPLPSGEFLGFDWGTGHCPNWVLGWRQGMLVFPVVLLLVLFSQSKIRGGAHE